MAVSVSEHADNQRDEDAVKLALVNQYLEDCAWEQEAHTRLYVAQDEYNRALTAKSESGWRLENYRSAS